MKQPRVCLALGLALGLVIGALLPHTPAHAVATDRFENFALCTAPLDNEVEALYFFDFNAVQLKAVVLNTYSGGFTNLFFRDVSSDFNLAEVTTPRFLMVSGLFTPKRSAATAQYANSAVYICELTTGQVCAYSVPWNRALVQNPPKAVFPITKVGAITLREIVRPNP